MDIRSKSIIQESTFFSSLWIFLTHLSLSLPTPDLLQCPPPSTLSPPSATRNRWSRWTDLIACAHIFFAKFEPDWVPNCGQRNLWKTLHSTWTFLLMHYNFSEKLYVKEILLSTQQNCIFNFPLPLDAVCSISFYYTRDFTRNILLCNKQSVICIQLHSTQRIYFITRLRTRVNITTWNVYKHIPCNWKRPLDLPDENR